MNDEVNSKDYAPATHSTVSSDNIAAVIAEQKRLDGQGSSSLSLVKVQALGPWNNTSSYELICALPSSAGIDPVTQPSATEPQFSSTFIDKKEFDSIKQEIEALGTLSPSGTIPESKAREMKDKHCSPLIG